ncbi:MAG: hypothetical protein AAF717_05440 [Bacteroidota bacterium]
MQRYKQFMIRSYVCGFVFVCSQLLPGVNDLTGIFNFIENNTIQYTDGSSGNNGNFPQQEPQNKK